MKFLCDNCKAKYQIADEKVAGKTVRMKCRKCGHQIEVRAAVTETSVSAQAPRPPASASAAPRTPQKSGLATSLSAAKPRAPSASGAPGSALAGAFKSNVQDAPASVPSEAQSASIELSVTDEWYVAINGVPVGPVRISEIRRKAATGAVTEESLCWQEGLEEWRPIRSIPDLAAIVREAAQGNRPSLIGPPPAPEPSVATRPPTAPATPRQALAAPAPPRNTPPPAPPPPARPMAPSTPFGGRSNVVPLRPAASSSSIDEVPLGPIGGSGSAAAIAPSLSPTPSPMFSASPVSSPLVSSPLAPIASPDPFAIPPAPAPPAPVSSSATPHRDESVASIVPTTPTYDTQKKAVPLWFWPILVLALGFGGGIAFIAFRPQPVPAPVVIQVPTPAPTTPPTPTTIDQGDVPPPPAETAPTASVEAKTKTGPVAARGPTSTAKTPEPEKKGLDLGNLVPGGGGPNVGPSSPPGGGSGGGLDQAGVERVVAMHRTGVKRTCWERGGGDKSSVNVTVSANVAPNGSVSSTSSSGDDPVVAKCIENQVRSWQFPAPGSSTTINIPFKFVRQ